MASDEHSEPDVSGPTDDEPTDEGVPSSGPSGADVDRLDPAAEDFDPDDGAAEAHTALPPRVEAWRKRSAAGAILTGFALGLQEALETKRDDPSIVIQTSGDPPKDLPVDADFEYGRPKQSVVQIRPWLTGDGRTAPARPKADEEPEE
ncbi:MAG TPA: hypothetical protein VG435_12455 [Acidimicrobiales bacterium]|nr:hypothetical protein [Acidimicrobiales bacterium]